MSRLYFAIAFHLTAIWTPAAAFDQRTHAAITANALSQSQLTASAESSEIARRLGLFDPQFLKGPKIYVDIGSTLARDRNIAGRFLDELRDPITGLSKLQSDWKSLQLAWRNSREAEAGVLGYHISCCRRRYSRPSGYGATTAHPK